MTFDPGVVGALGAKVYIGTTATDGTTDTYHEIVHAESISAFGRTYTIVKFTPLATGAVEKFKGEYDDGDVKIGVGRDIADPGQAACLAARDYTGPLYYNMKIVHNDASSASGATPTTIRFKAKITSFTETIGTTQSPIKGEITAALKSGSIVEVAAT